MTVEEQLFIAAEKGQTELLRQLLAENPEKLSAVKEPYQWSLLHVAAHNGQAPVVELLLQRGLDVNTREKGDNTYALHWAAAAGHADVVRLLADAGGDVIGAGDDHELEVIGWATCWDGCDDDAHRAVVEVLRGRGAEHHIFSAIAFGVADEVRRIVSSDPSALSRQLSRNESHQLPLQFAVRRGSREMVSLLLELGADPDGVDGAGHTVAAYATQPDVDLAVMQSLLDSGKGDLVTALVIKEWELAERHLRDDAAAISRTGALHLMAKRNDIDAVRWLLDHGANPNALWSHWEAQVTALHLAALHGHTDVVRLLLASGADPTIRDSVHDSDPLGWAEHSGKIETTRVLQESIKN